MYFSFLSLFAVKDIDSDAILGHPQKNFSLSCHPLLELKFHLEKSDHDLNI